MKETDEHIATLVRSTLRKVRLFAEWPHDVLNSLAGSCGVRKYQDGERVFAMGVQPEHAVVLVYGAICNTRTWPNGKHMLFEILLPGQVTGILPLLDGMPPAFDATARGETSVVTIPRSAMLAALRGSDERAMDMIQMLCRRARLDYENLEVRTMNSLRCRLAKVLLYLARGPNAQHGGHADIPTAITQDDIAAMMGIARQSVNRELRGFEKAGLIAIRYKHITVLDLSRLASVAQEDAALSPEAQTLVFGKPPDLYRATD